MLSLAVAERTHRRAKKRALAIGTGVVLLLGLFWASSIGALAAYLLVVAASLLPTFMWARLGRPGVPILPAMGALNILYYAFPLVRGREDLSEYSGTELLRAAATVSLFLALAALASHLVLRRNRATASAGPGALSGAQMTTLIFLGLALGSAFLGAASAGLLWGLGTFFGLARSVALTALVVSCYFLGVARGRGLLRGWNWALAGGGLGLAVVISWSSLYLIGGLFMLLAAGVGYVTTGGRIPWLQFGLAVALVSILHAGKEEMRGRYWQQDAGGISSSGVLQIPARLIEWFALGLESLSSPSQGRSALDRASLLQMLLRVQRLTPEFVDYLRGETYALLPGMLVPRFLDSDKTISKAGLDLLSIRYGLMSREATEKTTIGWGLVAEAFANFGFPGVAGMGFIIGLASGALTRGSARGAPVSFSTLLAVAAMVALINLEQDFASLVTGLLQSTAAVFVFVVLLRLFSGRRPGAPVRIERAANGPERPQSLPGFFPSGDTQSEGSRAR